MKYDEPEQTEAPAADAAVEGAEVTEQPADGAEVADNSDD